MLPPFADAFSQLSERTLATVPKYLSTLRSYLFLGPRRFFLRSEVASDAYMSPWHFFLLSASLGAVLAVLVDVTAPPAGWDWALYRNWFLFALVQDFILVPCGFIAAWLLVQKVSADSLLTAFAYASAWRPLTLPAIAYMLTSLERPDVSGGLIIVASATMVAYDVYLILGMAAHSFIEGQARWSFVILTVTLVVLIQFLFVLFALTPRNALDFVFVSTRAALTGKDRTNPHCDDAIIQGYVNARGWDTFVWFEWGEAPSLGRRTRPRRYLDDGPAYEPLVNLRENTKYYYRIAVRATNRVSYGELESFVTSDCNKPLTGSL